MEISLEDVIYHCFKMTRYTNKFHPTNNEQTYWRIFTKLQFLVIMTSHARDLTYFNIKIKLRKITTFDAENCHHPPNFFFHMNKSNIHLTIRMKFIVYKRGSLLNSNNVYQNLAYFY